ncbi:MAG: hypothetical protein FWE19_03640 [Oscillospiraceae bacterium]|nr:hypothetical protein [Oscillospiraceae bacterium]
MDYFYGKDFQRHREKIAAVLERIPSTQSPNGWLRKETFAIGGLEYFGFAENSDILFVISSSGRSLIDMAKDEKISRDNNVDFPLDERLLTSEGFDILKGETIKLASKHGGSMLPVSNKSHETLTKVSPLYPCEDIIFQPPYEHCLSEWHSKNCVRVYRGFPYCYGFSFSGKYFVIAHEGGITYWEAEQADQTCADNQQVLKAIKLNLSGLFNGHLD